MTIENRKFFENELLKELKSINFSKSTGTEKISISVSKKKIKLKFEKEFIAELYMEHLTNANGYYLGWHVYGGPIFDCTTNLTAPYNSNLLNKACCSFTTLKIEDKKLTLVSGGVLKTPSPEDAIAISKHIRQIIEEDYLPKIVGCIIASERTIQDVIDTPSIYAYPAIFIHCAIMQNPKIAKKELLEKVFSNKKIIKDKNFDLELLKHH
ncbi:hypothetical protein ALQ08_02633 [Pseudomonas syringae pv. delphinii]|uniref:Uncharacterized protein n=1 Tax=Pseudomonas syringae pv. delphinii TaxID=192088 RepID=A0A3M4AL06_9PSED|nr:hypothetical protein [Pseudomonas syringae group genomosp. 3]RMP07578.1 hypothetical protein ALQ28_00889 [Pseudomonas syringae pv. delphinii]RMQ16033.1 hypothetical protein ALQ08_02633 [Pseudomonas syringae pv. delphinii]